MTQRVTLLLIEQRSLVRECLASALAATWSEVELSVAERIPPAGPGRFDLILLSIGRERRSDQVTAEVEKARQNHPDVPIVVLSDSAERRLMRAAEEAGADEFTATCDTGLEETIATLKRVDAKQSQVRMTRPPERADQPQPATPGSSRAASTEPFTSWELHLLSKLGDHKSNDTIAEELGLRPILVKLHLRHVMRKAGLTRRSEVVALVQQLFNKQRAI